VEDRVLQQQAIKKDLIRRVRPWIIGMSDNADNLLTGCVVRSFGGAGS